MCICTSTYAASFFMCMVLKRMFWQHPSSSAWVQYDSTRPQFLRAAITGPVGTPYEGGIFIFDMHCPENYPDVPPKVTFLTTAMGTMRFSPNLYTDGKVRARIYLCLCIWVYITHYCSGVLVSSRPTYTVRARIYLCECMCIKHYYSDVSIIVCNVVIYHYQYTQKCLSLSPYYVGATIYVHIGMYLCNLYLCIYAFINDVLTHSNNFGITRYT